MKKSFIIISSIITLLCSCSVSRNFTAEDVSKWSDKQVQKWYRQSEWHTIGISPATDMREFARQCALNPELWHEAYLFLSDEKLTSLSDGNRKVGENGLSANVQTYQSKPSKGRKYENHRKFVDIQWVLTGNEIIELTDIKGAGTLSKPYKGDAEFYDGTSDFIPVKANRENCLIIFPDQPHKPGCQDGEPAPIHKVVVKVPYTK